MTAEGVRAPVCPGCSSEPVLLLDHQYWCGSDDCRVLVWDPTQDPATFEANAEVIDLGAFGNYTATGMEEEK